MILLKNGIKLSHRVDHFCGAAPCRAIDYRNHPDGES
jgi:hypothetical protein